MVSEILNYLENKLLPLPAQWHKNVLKLLTSECKTVIEEYDSYCALCLNEDYNLHGISTVYITSREKEKLYEAKCFTTKDKVNSKHLLCYSDN